MSADLLRRAATKLREHVERMAEADILAEGMPWEVEEDEDDSLYVVANLSEYSTVYIAEGYLSRAHADFAALLHPPVALALAKLLECEVLVCEAGGHVHPGAVDIARAVLREPEEES